MAELLYEFQEWTQAAGKSVCHPVMEISGSLRIASEDNKTNIGGLYS